MAKQNLIIYDKTWRQIGFIDSYTSLIWTKRYTSFGDFELNLSYNIRLTEIFKIGYFVELEGTETEDGRYAMIIEHIEYKSDSKGKNITVKGSSLVSLLNRRVLYNEIVFTGTKFEFISKLIDDCYGNTAYPMRIWKNFVVNDKTIDKLIRVRAAGRGENLGDAISEFCESTGTGIDILYKNDKYYIYIYEYESKADKVTFSREFENLIDCIYIEDITDYANVARIKSDDAVETAPRVDLRGDSVYTGLDRFEVSLNTDLIGQTTTYNAMQASGLKQLREHQNTMGIEADIVSNLTYVYGVDYFLGDIVTVKTEFNITATAQITAITESWESTEHTVIPSFGNFKILEAEDEEAE